MRGARGGRGRGRGAYRGRGGGRGRGRGQNDKGPQANEWDFNEADRTSDVRPEVDIDKNVTDYFVGTAHFDQHFDAQKKNRFRYAAAIAVLEKNGVDISQNAKVRALAAAWARTDHELANALLQRKDSFSLVEVLKALSLLDSARSARAIEKKVKHLEMSGAKLGPKKKGKFKSDVDNLNAVRPKVGSANGSVCKHIRRWVRTLTKKDLEFYALHFPKDPWKKLADVCHFHPQKDFPNLTWFLPYCFGSPAPEGTMAHQCRDLTANNVNDLLKEYPIPYSHVRKFKDRLTAESKGRIGSTNSLEHVLWYYEDLMCPELDQVIKARLENGETVTFPDGKLMERLLTLKMIREDISLSNVTYVWDEETETLSQRVRKPDDTKAPFFDLLLPIAQKKLENISLPLESPIVVMGDMSGSMDVAIRTSTIIAGLLTAITSAKLVFFNTQNKDADVIPHNIEEVLEMAVAIEADGATAPAASLHQFYERKEVVKTFILVTDEVENEQFKGYSFLDLYKKYHAEVYPAHLVFVSFLPDQHATGQMVNELVQNGFQPSQFKFSGQKPDLTKLDNLFGLLASKTATFEEQLAIVQRDLEMNGMREQLGSMSVTESDD